MPVGTKIKFKINNIDYNHILVQQGRPSTLYDAAFDNVSWLLIEDCYDERRWGELAVSSRVYANSEISTWMNSTYYNLIEPTVKDICQSMPIPYREGTSGSAVTTTNQKACILSSREVSTTGFASDGSMLSYFSPNTNAIRVALYNGVGRTWWLRSVGGNTANTAYNVKDDGSISVNAFNNTCDTRPCIFLPKTTKISSQPNPDGSYSIFAEVPAPTKSFGESSWDEINEIALSGNIPSTWAVGDEKTITLSTNEQITLCIYGFNHDNIDTGGKATFTIGMKYLMSTLRRMSPTWPVGGYDGSELHQWLNADLKSSLPADLQAVIKTARKLTEGGLNNGVLYTQSMDIFLPSEIEVYGSNPYSWTGEGTKYAYYTSAATRTKGLANGTQAAVLWWLRSPSKALPNNFCYIGSDGQPASSSSVNISLGIGVSWAFCI